MTPDPDNAGRGQGGRFSPGCSGNPTGMKATAARLLVRADRRRRPMVRGVLSAEEAQAAAAVLEHHREAVETLDLERRITALEGEAE